jgi:hypothetical protein
MPRQIKVLAWDKTKSAQKISGTLIKHWEMIIQRR